MECLAVVDVVDVVDIVFVVFVVVASEQVAPILMPADGLN
jgi:hypothetical protein